MHQKKSRKNTRPPEPTPAPAQPQHQPRPSQVSSGMTNLFSKLGRVASRAGRVFKPRHGIKHYVRKHSGHVGLIAAGVGIGAASDLAIDAIKGEPESPPIYYMEGGENVVMGNCRVGNVIVGNCRVGKCHGIALWQIVD